MFPLLKGPRGTHKAWSEPEASGPGQGQETWASGLVSTRTAHCLGRLPEEESEGQRDPHACGDRSLCVKGPVRGCAHVSHPSVMSSNSSYRQGLRLREGLIPRLQTPACSLPTGPHTHSHSGAPASVCPLGGLLQGQSSAVGQPRPHWE